MKRTLIVLFATIVAVYNCQEEGDGANRWAKEVSNYAIIPQRKAQICINKTNVKFNDVENFIISEGYINKDNDWRTMNFDDKALKVGTFFVCLAEEKGMIPITENTILDNVKQSLKEIVRNDRSNLYSSNTLIKVYQVVDECVDNVKNESDNCKMSLRFVLCFVKEEKRVRESTGNYI